ncbi:hypothetical protein ACFCYI_03975 [Streptomyces sp. NPDC056257]|uniref:hypothetical protein n=1 Tax=Streptomyces sp. NPDC056257 TaxID=3345765 RepID=UPI0035DDC14A
MSRAVGGGPGGCAGTPTSTRSDSRSWLHFPDDLLDLQAAWLRAYTDLARQPARAGTTALRRRLIMLSCRIEAHPFWASRAAPGPPGSSCAAAPARAWVTAA